MDANWILFILSRKKKICEICTLVCGKTTLIDSISTLGHICHTASADLLYANLEENVEE